MLKFPIIVRSVTNLSDARYCAGMGVEYLSFDFDPESQYFIEENTFLGIIGWLSGVKLIIELNSSQLENSELLNRLTEKYAPNNFLIKNASTHYSIKTTTPIIYELNVSHNPLYFPAQDSLVILSSDNHEDKLHNYQSLLKDLVYNYKYHVFPAFGFDKDNIEQMHSVYAFKGFCLKGGNEIAPGLKNFDELADILETIES